MQSWHKLVHCNSASGFITKFNKNYCHHFENASDIIFILLLMFQLRILRGKQHLERKFEKCEYRSFPSRCIKPIFLGDTNDFN